MVLTVFSQCILALVGNHVLYFTILFVYSTVAPIVNFVLGFLLLLLASLFRHQFIYIYPPTPDSGGRLWLNFMKLIVSCMVCIDNEVRDQTVFELSHNVFR
jgi:hypothetical protein